MIDVESQIYTPIAEALRAQFPGILVSGEYVNAPTRFPYVSLVEQDNYTTEAHMDSGDTERFASSFHGWYYKQLEPVPDNKTVRRGTFYDK